MVKILHTNGIVGTPGRPDRDHTTDVGLVGNRAVINPRNYNAGRKIPRHWQLKSCFSFYSTE